MIVSKNNELHSLLEADISDIELDFGQNKVLPAFQKEYALANYYSHSYGIPEVPFIHWSIYRQGIQNLVNQQGQKLAKNPKQLSKFMSQMYKNVLFTAIDQKVFYQWMLKFNLIMYQSGHTWKNNQIK